MTPGVRYIKEARWVIVQGQEVAQMCMEENFCSEEVAKLQAQMNFSFLFSPP